MRNRRHTRTPVGNERLTIHYIGLSVILVILTVSVYALNTYSLTVCAAS